MDIIKKSFELNGDLAQMIDDFVGRNPGLSFTFIANKALDSWLEKGPPYQIGIGASVPRGITTVKKSANIKAESVSEIEKIKSCFAGLNTTLIMNAAIQLWLRNPKFDVSRHYTETDVDKFLDENSDIMDELAK